MTTSSTAQAWLDTERYPFNAHFHDFQEGKMHYVDEGQGEVLLFVHGTPTWSFLYRNFIQHFSKNYRCIAPDHLGFGLSEAPPRGEGSPQAHSRRLAELIRALDLQNITLVVHDFGGPIGWGAALEMPNRIKRVVCFNTWLWATADDKKVQRIDGTVNSWLGKCLYLRLNISPKLLLKRGFEDKKKLSKELHQQYIAPFPNKNSRYPLLELAQALGGASDWYAQLWEQRHKLTERDIPFLFLWGTEDSFITPDFLERWTAAIPQAQVHRYDCGHFVQEERSQEAIADLEAFLEQR